MFCKSVWDAAAAATTAAAPAATATAAAAAADDDDEFYYFHNYFKLIVTQVWPNFISDDGELTLKWYHWGLLLKILFIHWHWCMQDRYMCYFVMFYTLCNQFPL